MNVQYVKESNTNQTRYRVISANLTLGWITEWTKTDVLTDKKSKLYAAKTLDGSTRIDCESLGSALAFIAGHYEDQGVYI